MATDSSLREWPLVKFFLNPGSVATVGPFFRPKSGADVMMPASGGGCLLTLLDLCGFVGM